MVVDVVREAFAFRLETHRCRDIVVLVRSSVVERVANSPKLNPVYDMAVGEHALLG